MTTSPSEKPELHFGAKGQLVAAGGCGTGVQQPVEFGNPLVEADQFVGALDGVCGVGVVADGTAIIAHFGFKPVAPFPQPSQLAFDAFA